MNKLALIQEIENLTFVINEATKEIIYDIKRLENRTTTHYIWRTRGDGKVRSRHAKFNGKIFAWDSPPAGGYHPGEDYGCRCIAEPYTAEKLQERISQTVTSATADQGSTWSEDDFFNHYRHGNGRMVRLSEIGHLQKIIDHAQTFDQGGGSIFERVEQDIIKQAHANGEGSFPYHFRNSYEFQPVLRVIGGATVAGSGRVTVVDKEEFWMITADLNYAFSDEFTDPYDYNDWVPGEFNPDGTPYHITDSWTTRFAAVVKK